MDDVKEILTKVNLRLVEKNEVILDIDDYDNLMERSKFLEMFTSSMFENASLSYDEEHLRFDNDELNMILRFMSPFAYKDKIDKLKKEKEAKEKEKENGANQG